MKKIIFVLVFCLMIAGLCQAQEEKPKKWKFDPAVHFHLFSFSVNNNSAGFGTGGIGISFYEKMDWELSRGHRTLGIAILPRLRYDKYDNVEFDYFISFLLYAQKDYAHHDKIWANIISLGYSPKMKEVMYVFSISF